MKERSSCFVLEDQIGSDLLKLSKQDELQDQRMEGVEIEKES